MNLHVTKSPIQVNIEDMPKYRLNGNAKGRVVHIGESDEYISLKAGYPTFITGQPHSGKTEFAFEIILNDIKYNAAKWLIISTESGSTVELYGQLVEKWKANGGKIFKSSKYALTDEEVDESMKYFQKHIRTIDPEDEWNKTAGLEFNLSNIFEIIEREEGLLNAHFDGILIDPFNDLELDSSKRIDQQVKDEVKELLRYGKKAKKTIMLTIHANDTKPILMGQGDSKYYYYPPARPQDLQGGQQFFRKGYQIINVYRPRSEWIRFQMDNPDMVAKHHHRLLHGSENDNMTSIIIQKSKPKGIGKLGTFYIFYDPIKQRYYDVDERGYKKYSTNFEEPTQEQEQKTNGIHPNVDFNEDKIPF